MDLPEKIVFVDIETTGCRITSDRIIEIGILRVENNELVDTYQTLINPQAYLSPFIENMTGIHHEDLIEAPIFNDVKDKILEKISDCVFVAHNVRFDYGFLRNEFRRYNINFSSKHFCTARLSKLLFPRCKKHNLDSIIKRFGFNCANRHRAFDDAKVLWDFIRAIKGKLSPVDFSNAIKKVMKKASIPTLLTENDFDSLPESPGVYIFYSLDNMPLYVGKSVNIKERVMSHFSGDFQSSKEMSMCSQTARIEVVGTAGELGALLKESEMVKSLQPFYNRQLRVAKKLTIARKKTNKEGYETIGLEENHDINVKTLDSIMAVFKSKKQAKDLLNSLAKEYFLCQKYLGLEKTKSSCFSHKLGICKGACIGLESPLQYNCRFIMAFSNYKIKTWPFKGPILIEEKDVYNSVHQGFVVNNWCLLDVIKGNCSNFPIQKINGPAFDLDTYKILLRYLKTTSNLKKVKPFNILT